MTYLHGSYSYRHADTVCSGWPTYGRLPTSQFRCMDDSSVEMLFSMTPLPAADAPTLAATAARGARLCR
jgi:hypothetical protein